MRITSPSGKSNEPASLALHRSHHLLFLRFGGLWHHPEKHAARDGALRRLLLRHVPVGDFSGGMGHGIAATFRYALNRRSFFSLPKQRRRRRAWSQNQAAYIAQWRDGWPA